MIQCFLKNNYAHPLGGSVVSVVPQLLYVSKINEDDSLHPRVMHKHPDFIEIVLVCSGRAKFFVGGRQVEVKEGDVIIYNSGVIHDEISGPNIKLATYCAAIGQLALPGLNKNTFIHDKQHPVFATGGQFAALREIFALMFDQLSQKAPSCEVVAHHLMQALLAIVWEIVHTGEAASQPIDDEPLAQRIRSYLDQHYAENISLQELANALHVSTFYLAHIFKAAYGYSPMQYILRRRIGEAQTLLISTNLSVTAVADRVGYDNPSHFNQLFTKNVGQPPLKYKKNYIRTT